MRRPSGENIPDSSSGWAMCSARVRQKRSRSLVGDPFTFTISSVLMSLGGITPQQVTGRAAANSCLRIILPFTTPDITSGVIYIYSYGAQLWELERQTPRLGVGREFDNLRFDNARYYSIRLWVVYLIRGDLLCLECVHPYSRGFVQRLAYPTSLAAWVPSPKSYSPNSRLASSAV